MTIKCPKVWIPSGDVHKLEVTEEERMSFETAVFNQRFMHSIVRNPNPVSQWAFVTEPCPTKAELCERDMDGEYIDEAVNAMFFGFRIGLVYSTKENARLLEEVKAF